MQNDYKLIFALEFYDDLDNVYSNIARTLLAPNAAQRLMKRIDDAIVNLKAFHKMCPLCAEPLKFLDYRKLIVDGYIIVYYVDDEKKNVYLLRCFWGKQNYLDLF